MASWNFASGGSATLGPPPSGKIYIVTGVSVTNIASAPQSSHYYDGDKFPANTYGPGSVYLTVSGAASGSAGPAPLGSITYDDSAPWTHGDANGNSLSVSLGSVTLRGSSTITASYNSGWVGSPNISWSYTEQSDTVTISFEESGTITKTETVQPGSTITLPSHTKNYDVTVTFDANGGSVNPSSKSATRGFAGWRYNGTYYSEGSRVTVNESRTYVGAWGTGTVSGFPVPSLDGYAFEGWYNGTSKISSYTGENNVTVKAHYMSSPVWVMTAKGWKRLIPSGASGTTVNYARNAKTNALAYRIRRKTSTGWEEMKGPTKT